MLNTFKKYCHFGNLSDHSIVFFFQTAVDMCPVHDIHAVAELCRVVAMKEIVLSTHIMSLRME